MSFKHLPLFALALLPLAPARAADLTPAEAQTLERQVQEWIGGMLGPNVKLASRPVQIAPEGDHYLVALPFGEAADSPRLTATARPSDGGRWTIDNMHVPSPVHFALNLPKPGGKGDKAPLSISPVAYELILGQQSGQLLLDPAYASPSTLSTSVGNMDLSASGEGLRQTSHIGRAASTSILRPSTNGRVDVIMDSTVENYRLTSKTPDIEEMELTIGRGRVGAEFIGVSRERSVQVLQAAMQLGAAVQMAAGGASPQLGEPARATQVLLDALADLATGISVDETLDRCALSYAGMAGSLNAVRLGFAAKSDGGVLSARMELGAEGLTLPELGLGELVQLIPSKLALRPAVSGIATADLVRVIKASQGGGTPAPADIAALFSHGGISAGLDSFSIEMGGTGFAGLGKLVFTSPEAFSGSAQITATNLDLLQQRIASNPQLAQAVPVFIMAKGMGRTVNNQIVWDITYQNGRLLVNNQDLTAMMGGAPPAEQPKAPARGPGKPQGPRR